jgi:solute carrier family 25 (mitochondrial adenine nucleotide translocator), member 4/5/6/31
MNESVQHGPAWKEAVAGAIAGTLSRSVVAPIERVKLILQLRGSLGSEKTAPPRQNALAVARTIYREQGIISFWRGNLPNCLRVSGSAALNFTCMDYYKHAGQSMLERVVVQNDSSASTLQRKRRLVSSLVSGGLAGATSTTLLYPLEFARTRLAMDGGTTSSPRKYKGMWHAVVSIFKTDGIVGLYQGYGIALVGGIVYRLLYLGGYDALKGEVLFAKNRQESGSEKALTWGERVASAQVISLAAGTLSYPLDSVRRRMMMQAGKALEKRLYRNSIHCISCIFTTEGIRGFYLGLGPNIVRSVGGALVLVSYDGVRAML